MRFANPDSAHGGQHEFMWVRIIAYHRPSDLFLGFLLNQPAFLQGVVEGDNVVFRVGASNEFLVALGIPRYGTVGWPEQEATGFTAALTDGIRAYRTGNNGHHMPGIERCIAVLTPALSSAPASATSWQRFVGHYVLGRCLAESYATEKAVEQFRAAIALDSMDLHAHMALLAEYSVMTHRRPGELPDAQEAQWERDFRNELALVQQRFSNDDRVKQVLTMIFDPAMEERLDPVWEPHVAKLRRVGYAVFRWKQR